MDLVSIDQIKTPLATVIERLENAPVEFVEQLIDLLAAPERKREPHLLQDLLLQIWLLLECPESFEQSASPISESKIPIHSARVTPYERTIQLVCRVIETEIVRHLHFNRDTPSLISGRTSQLFWGGMTLHIKLALPLEPQHGSAIFSNQVVTLSNGKSFPCELFLSESKIYQLIAQLGHSFVSEYVASYICDERLRDVVARISQGTKKQVTSKNSSDPLELLVQERTLNRYVDKFANRLAAHFRDSCKRFVENPPSHFRDLLGLSSPDSLLSQWIANAADALCINPKPIELHNRELNVEQSSTHVRENYSPDGASRIVVSREFDHRETLEKFIRLQEEIIRESFQTTFVSQNLTYRHADSTEPRNTEISEMVDLPNPHLVIVAPPGGGKTRLLQEVLLLSARTHTYHLYLDVAEFSVPRFRTFYHFAAYEILTFTGSDRRDILKLESELLRLDTNGNIVWYLDNWNCNSQRDLSLVNRSLAGLGKSILSAASSFLPNELLSLNCKDAPSFVTIQPFTQTQIAEFIKTNSTSRNPARTRIERRALQLPGLARLPQGLQYICAHPEHETVTDMLLGFLNSTLQKNNEAVFNLQNLDHPNLAEAINESSAIGSAFLIVKALGNWTRGTAIDFDYIAVDAILPYMGMGNQVENRRGAIERIERAVEGKLVQANADGRTFRFVVPEIGCLLAAFVRLLQHHRNRWLGIAFEQFHAIPFDSICEMMLALGAWHQEKNALRDITALSDGTVVPF